MALALGAPQPPWAWGLGPFSDSAGPQFLSDEQSDAVAGFFRGLKMRNNDKIPTYD